MLRYFFSSTESGLDGCNLIGWASRLSADVDSATTSSGADSDFPGCAELKAFALVDNLTCSLYSVSNGVGNDL